MNEIHAKFTVNAESMWPGILLGTKLSTLWRKLLFSVLAMVIIAILYLPTGSFGTVTYALIFFAIAYVIFFDHLVASLALRRFKKATAYGKEIEFIFSDERIQSKLPDSEGSGGYTILLKTITAPQDFLLYTQPMLFQWIPRSAFLEADGYDRLAALLAEKTKNRVVK